MNAELMNDAEESSQAQQCHDIIVSLRNSKNNSSLDLDISSFTGSVRITSELEAQYAEFALENTPKVKSIFYGENLVNIPHNSINCLVSQKFIQNLHNKRKHKLIHDTFRILIKSEGQEDFKVVNFVFQVQEIQYKSATNHINHIDFIIKNNTKSVKKIINAA